MTPEPKRPISQRVLTVVFAVAVALAIVGFLAGTRPATKLPRVLPERSQKTAAPSAKTYTELRKNRAERSAAAELADLALAIKGQVPTTAPTDAQRQAALRARGKLRAYNGAPPVIPHGITQKSSASCLACHRKGALVKGKLAPRLSHPEYTSCTQCHVPSQSLGPNNMPKTTNSFAGVQTAGRGKRVSIGAPPTIPHSTWMRKNCVACHGPTGKPGLRTTHPQRTSCRQCHAPNMQRHPAAGVPQ